MRVTGIDNSPDAIDVARENAERHGLDVEFMIADLIVGGPYDLIVSNPPYVRESEWPGLAPEITLYEPREALLGGPDGLDVIRDLVPARRGAGARRDARGRGGPGPVAGRGGAVRAGRPALRRDGSRPGRHPAGGEGTSLERPPFEAASGTAASPSSRPTRSTASGAARTTRRRSSGCTR